jgi:TPR repeat protein
VPRFRRFVGNWKNRRQGIVMHRVWIRALSSAPIVLSIFLTAAPARADLYSAQVAYEKQDFKTAFAQFKELAELGQPHAQYNLAALCARGEGVPMNLTYAHTWASLAGQNGEAKGADLATALQC